ncbi:membrane-associated protein, putative [Bodo saltans]|uniref:Membrane-associated protein, putative n=1 Tax=Bodo saltans TaxID=75058 RepID=A0A0S4J9L1_BODSA|nr:membrane-associated protein, putative [Bodo saltans]|eukprot:CUG86174.1 membrane-associated protein, putative [Bodo saltans]
MSSSSKHTYVAVGVLLALAAGTAFAAQQQQPKYVVGFLPNGPAGYAPASLADLKTPEFLEQYNSVGLGFVQRFPNGYLCCVVGVAEGLLSIGPSDSYSNYIEPYLDNVDTCTGGTQPNGTTFGVPGFSAGPYENMWISNLTTKEQNAFRVTGVIPTGAIANCGFNYSQYTTIFKALPPKYVIRPSGPNYPAPNTSEYVVASLADLKSADFQAFYNETGGVLLAGTNTTNYCCLLRVADGGWLYYGSANNGAYSPLTLFNQFTSAWACNAATNDQIHSLGTSFGGPNSGLVFDTLNPTTTAQFGSFRNNTQNWDGCGSNLPNSLTVFKRASLPKYIVQVYGPNFPAPPASQYAVATLADVLSQDFQDSYNAAGGVYQPALSSTHTFCCIVQVAGNNYLNYNVATGLSPITTYTEPSSQSSVTCSEISTAQWADLGTAYGINSGSIFSTLNSTVTSQFNTFTSATSNWCGNVPDSKTLFKRVY